MPRSVKDYLEEKAPQFGANNKKHLFSVVIEFDPGVTNKDPIDVPKVIKKIQKLSIPGSEGIKVTHKGIK